MHVLHPGEQLQMIESGRRLVDIRKPSLLAVSALLALFPSGSSQANSGAAQDRRQDHCAFLSVSYKANRESIPFGTFRFRYTRARAGSLEDAQARRYTNSVEARGLYIFDEHDARFELVIAASEQGRITKKVGQNQIVSFFQPIRRLTDGKTSLIDYLYMADPQHPAQVHIAKIVPGTDEFYRDLSFPLEIGSASPTCSDLSSGLDQVARGGAAWRLEVR